MIGSKLSCAICQPHYLSWIGYFEMIDRVDIFVFLDDVQFIKREWKNRNRIRKSATSSETKWLTVPIAKTSQNQMIKDARISSDWDWVTYHANSLKEVYSHTPFFKRYFPDIMRILTEHSKGTLGDLNIDLVKYFCQAIGIKTRMVKSSDLGVGGKREGKLLKICKTLGADFYLANNTTGQYVTADYFQREGIGFWIQNYQHPCYVQRYKHAPLPFLSHLSIVDLLFNCGDEAISVILKGKPLATGKA